MTYPCRVCDSTEYEELDGLYFCTTCCTQSQELIVQELDYNYSFSDSFRPLKEIRSKAKGKSISHKLGRPWTIYEAYQCIILAQCDALISLGAKEDLKDVVFLVWSNYLSKIKVAFCNNERIVPDIVVKTGHGRQREINRGTLEEPWNKNINKQSTNWIRDLDFDSHSSDEFASVEEILNVGKSYTKGTKRKRDGSHASVEGNLPKALGSPEWMDLKKTVAFCCIGLRVTNPEILKQQLIGWINEGKVPFMSTTHLLNPDMVLFGEDGRLFQPTSMTVQKLIVDMNKITGFLGINKIPVPSIDYMINHLLDKLHLPSDLNAICERFLKCLPHVIYGKSVWDKNMEFAAAKYILFAVKMVFGLDGTTEHLLSNYSQEVQKHIGSDINLFIWNEWRKYQIGKAKNEFDADKEKTNDLNYDYKHLDRLLESHDTYHKNEKHVWPTKDGKPLINFSGYKEQKIKDGLSTPLELAQCSPATTTGDHRGQKLKDGLSTPLELAQCSPTTTTASCKRLQTDETLKQRFIQSTLAHIIDFDAFKARYEDRIDRRSWKKLKKEKKTICKNMAYNNYDLDDSLTLNENRSSSYLWLLTFLVRIVGGHIVHLDMAVTELHNKFKQYLLKNC